MSLTTRFYLDGNVINPTAGQFVLWHEEFDGKGKSPKITLETDRSSATRVVQVAWGNWQSFAIAALGYASLSENRYGKPCLSRVPPWAMPLKNTSEGRHFLFADKIDIEGLGAPTPAGSSCMKGDGNDAIAVYERARCSIRFSTRTYEILGDQTMESFTVPSQQNSLPAPGNDEANLKRYVTKIVRPAGEFLTIDGAAYYFAGYTNDNDKPVALARGINKTIPSYNVAITWHLVPKEAVPSALYNPGAVNRAIDKCLGRVNRVTFDGARQGTMLLMAVEIKPIASPLGDRIFDITYMFKFFNPSLEEFNGVSVVGHNHIFRPIGGDSTPPTNGWYEVVASYELALIGTGTGSTNFIARTDGVNIYDWADFNNLFRPANYPPPP